jgi:hypothetical protein
MSREEQRKARARLDQERHLAKVKKEKAWLAANPRIAAQQEREKEEQRKNRETLRMLNTMKDEEIVIQQKKKKPINAFAALMDSDTEEEEQEEQEETCVDFASIPEENLDKIATESTCAVTLSKPEEIQEPAVDLPPEKKKFVWADECDE